MIEVQHLCKQYGNRPAVKDLSFTVEDRGVIGFLGPNGAGKSTTMNMMTGCLAATSGTVLIDGADIFEEPEKAKAKIGYLPEIPPLYLEETPAEYLRFVAEAKKLPGNRKNGEIERVMKITGLEEVKDRLCRNLSKGYRQRVGIAQALLGDPEIIILDEPTVGLDPLQIIEIRELIRQLGETHTVILSSHILSEVQAVCRTILIINRGELVAQDCPENLEKLFAGKSTVELLAEGGEELIKEIALREDVSLESLETEGQDVKAQLECSAERERELCRCLFLTFAAAGIPLLRLEPKRASLEDIFIELTRSEAEPSEKTKEKEEET